MPSLLYRPSDDALHLFRVVALGYDQAAGVWPCWQWVKQQLWLQDRDAEELLQGLPTWRHGYRSVRAGNHGQLPDNGDPIPLTRVLDADIDACFDTISHQALMDRVRARVKDKRVLALVKALLNAEVRTELDNREDT